MRHLPCQKHGGRGEEKDLPDQRAGPHHPSYDSPANKQRDECRRKNLRLHFSSGFSCSIFFGQFKAEPCPGALISTRTALNDEADSSNKDKPNASIDHEKTDREVAAESSMPCASSFRSRTFSTEAFASLLAPCTTCLVVPAMIVAANVAFEFAESDVKAVAALIPVAPTATINAIATTLFPTIFIYLTSFLLSLAA